jgi:hypothetical protein
VARQGGRKGYRLWIFRKMECLERFEGGEYIHSKTSYWLLVMDKTGKFSTAKTKYFEFAGEK